MSKANGAATAITATARSRRVFNGVDHVRLTSHYDPMRGE